jgi:hypothetical protein
MDMSGSNSGTIIGLICCGPIFIITITILSVLVIKIRRKDWGRIWGRAGTMVLVALFTTLLVIQTQFYYESDIFHDFSEARKPEFAYSDTNATIKISRITMEEDLYEAWDVLFIGRLGIVTFINDVDDQVMLRSKRILDGVTEVIVIPVVLLGSRTNGNPRGSTCDLEEEQGRFVCNYSFFVGDEDPIRIAYTTSTTDGLNWSVPARIVDYMDDSHDAGPDLPSKLTDFKRTDVDYIESLSTSEGGTLLALRYYETGTDVLNSKGTYFAMKPKHGEWTGLVRIPAWRLWHSGVKLHEVSTGRYVAVGMSYDLNIGDNLALAFFTDEALTNVRPPAPPHD